MSDDDLPQDSALRAELASFAEDILSRRGAGEFRPIPQVVVEESHLEGIGGILPSPGSAAGGEPPTPDVEPGLTEEQVNDLIDAKLAELGTIDLSVCVDGSATTITVLLPPVPE